MKLTMSLPKKARGMPYSLLCLAGAGLPLIAGLCLSLFGAGVLSLWLRVIIGLLVFLLPGCMLFMLAPPRDDWDLFEALAYGFSWSMALITLLGLILRTLSWSIDTLELVWYGLCLLGFAGLLLKFRRKASIQPAAPTRMHLVLIAIVACQLLMYCHASTLRANVSDDYNSRQGEINGFLRDDPLGWSEPYYETGNRISARNALSYAYLAQAFIVEVSGAPILLARFMLNPFVVIVSAAAMYAFARNLGRDRKSALLAVILGLLGMSLVAELGKAPGSQFFVHSKMDKNIAAFALAPIAISSAWLYWRSRRRRDCFGFAVSFFALAFTHAIIGGLSAVIIGLWCLIVLASRGPGAKEALVIGLLMLALLSPTILLRLTSSHPDIDQSAWQLPALEISLKMAGDWTALLLVLTLLALAARRSRPERALLLAFVLMIGFGLLSVGDWLYTRLVAHGSRVFWLMPYGYMLLFVIETASPRLARLRQPGLWLVVLALPVTAYFLQFNSRADFSRSLAKEVAEDSEILRAAAYIDAEHDEIVWIAASPERTYRNLSVAMSWKVKSLSQQDAPRMSYLSNMALEEAVQREADNFRLYKADVPVEEKLQIIDHYGIDYLLFPKAYAWLVDALYQQDKSRFELVYAGETLRLVRVHDSSTPLGPPETSGG